jgi:hypothetical protein
VIATPNAVQRVANVTTVTTTNGHPYAVDEEVELFYPAEDTAGFPLVPDPNFPAGVFTVIATPSTSVFQVSDPGANATSVAVETHFRSTDDDVTTTTGTALNDYAYAKDEQPDHWSLGNFGEVGGNLETLQWALPMDRFLFLGSEGGLYRAQGNANDGILLADGGVWSDTYRFLGRRNVAQVAGRGYALSRTGIVGWTESNKPEPVDGPIQQEIRALLATHAENLGRYGYFVGNETARRLYVYLTSTPGGTKPDLAYMLNLDAGPQSWTRLTSTFPGLEAGTQGPGIAPEALGGQLHLLPTNAVDGEILRERVTATNADYQGPAGEAIPSSIQYLPWTAGEPGRAKMWTHIRIFTRSPATQLKFAMSTDAWPAEYEQTLPDMGPLSLTQPVPVVDPIRGFAWPSLVGQDHRRARQVAFRVSHETAGEPLRLLGLEVKHRAYGP